MQYLSVTFYSECLLKDNADLVSLLTLVKWHEVVLFSVKLLTFYKEKEIRVLIITTKVFSNR